MAQIVARGTDTWLVRVSMGVDRSGKRVYHNKTIHGKKRDAERYARLIESERDNGTYVQPTKQKLEEYLDQWLQEYAQKRVSARTFKDYRSMMERHVYPRMGHEKLTEVQNMPMACQKLINEVESNSGVRTAQYVHMVFKQALAQALKLGLIARNPMELVDRPRDQKKTMMAMSQTDVKQFLGAAEGNRYFAFFALLIDTGMRPSEAMALRWEDVDLERRVIYVQHSLERDADGWSLKEPKTNKSRRSVPVTAGVARLLQQQKREQAERRLQSGAVNEDHGFVFTARNGEPLELHNVVNRYFKPILKKAGLSSDFRLYDLRHTCATLLLSAGENPKIIAERLGHASVTMTLDRYSHVLPDMQQGAVSKMENMLFA
ncbi:tyrosine-type recombinase/integrase [Alicyclobacillus fastidiosus]|uniref:Site-specific integrase n=1 Tax=Alicyclobacillus fastidiosus TaxID=392011 RepID=A0ABV5ALN5_9BACL